MSTGSIISRTTRRSVEGVTRRAILVLGMHRSGTSAVTRCLNLLGVDLGDRLLTPAEGNPKGFWEHADVVKTHEELLASLGRTWYDTRPLPKNWQSSKAALDARDKLLEIIRRDFSRSHLWTIKDPRLCRFVPLWRKVLKERGVDAQALLVVRHPSEVARSLKERNDLPSDAAYLSWLEHFAEAEAGSRGLLRTVISYDALLSDWQGELTRVAQDLRIEWPVPVTEAARSIDSFLDRGERHHEVTTAPAAMPDVLDRLYHLCSAPEPGELNWKEISSLVDVYNLMAHAFLGAAAAQQQETHVATKKSADIKCAADNSLSVGSAATEAKVPQSSATGGLDYAVLYYRTGDQEFAETRARHVPFKWLPTGITTLRFELPPHPGLLRFDPSGHSDAFNLRAMRLNGVAVKDLRGLVRNANQYVLASKGDDGIWFASIDSDPWIEIDVNGLIQDGEPLIVEIDCERHAFDEITGALTAAIAADMQRRIALSIESVAHQLSEMQGRTQQYIDTLQARNAELEHELTAAHDHEGRLTLEMEVLHARGVELEAELTANRTRAQRLTAEAAWRTGEVLQLQQSIEAQRQASASELEALRAEHAAQLAVTELLRNELAGIHASTLWRVLLKLRAFLLLIPPKLRSTLRRALKSIWWLMTPWRMPARRRFLKQRRRSESSAPDTSTLVRQDGGGVSPVKEPDVQPRAYIYQVPKPDPAAVRATLLGLSRPLFFSVVVPIYNTDPDLLRRMIESVQAQWYPEWELILVDDHSPSIVMREALEGLIDPRIMVVRLAENKRISGATNEGIQRAGGDYIVFLDHDDELTPDCLYELALCIDRDDPDYLYSDEDKLDVHGRFSEPFFKPDWSPDTMMSIMLTCHVSCVRRSLALEVGGLRSEYDGSQDWDFVLRVTERAQRIAHIPKVLYHWRIIPASCASDLLAKPYAVLASKAAREDALRRRGLSGELVPVPELPGYFRVRYNLQGKPLVSILIPTKNNGGVLKTCVDSIFEKSVYRKFEILVVNNGSTDAPTLEYLAELRGHDQVTVLDYDAPFNYSEINNHGVRHARGELLMFLNDDTEVVSPDWLDYMGGYAQLPHIGAVGAKLLYPGTQTVQHTGVVNFLHGPDHAFKHIGASDPGYFCRNLLEHNWIAVTGACLMIERKKFDAVGGFDEDLAVAYNDVALCFSLVERGWYQVVCPSIHLLHYESLSRGDDRLDPEKLARIGREQAILYRKHPTFKGRDPFHSANFIPDDPHFGIPM